MAGPSAMSPARPRAPSVNVSGSSRRSSTPATRNTRRGPPIAAFRSSCSNLPSANGLVGVHIQHDQSDVEIVVYNRAILLFTTDSEAAIDAQARPVAGGALLAHYSPTGRGRATTPSPLSFTALAWSR